MTHAPSLDKPFATRRKARWMGGHNVPTRSGMCTAYERIGKQKDGVIAGHADPRTTRLYDRRQKKITRNIVERISI